MSLLLCDLKNSLVNKNNYKLGYLQLYIADIQELSAWGSMSHSYRFALNCISFSTVWGAAFKMCFLCLI